MTQPKARARIFTNDLALAYEAADVLTEQTGELHHVVLCEVDPLAGDHTVAVANTRAAILAMQAGYSLDTFGLPAWAEGAAQLAQGFHDAEREGTPHGAGTVQHWTAQDFTREYHMSEFLPAESAQDFGQLAYALTRLERSAVTRAPLSPGDTVRVRGFLSALHGSLGQVVAVDESRPYSVTVQVQTFSEAAERAGLPYQRNAPFFSLRVEELEPDQ